MWQLTVIYKPLFDIITSLKIYYKTIYMSYSCFICILTFFTGFPAPDSCIFYAHGMSSHTSHELIPTHALRTISYWRSAQVDAGECSAVCCWQKILRCSL
jgi:hypothetical protein